MPRSGPGRDDLIAVDPDPAGGRPHIARHRVEQCRLAAARGTEQADERAGADIDRRVLERMIDVVPSRRNDTDTSQISIRPTRVRSGRRIGHDIEARLLSRVDEHHDGTRAMCAGAIGDGRGVSARARTGSPSEQDRNPEQASQCRATSASRRSAAARSAVATLTPSTARPTTQVGAAQHTTQVMVIDASAGDQRRRRGRGSRADSAAAGAGPAQPRATARRSVARSSAIDEDDHELRRDQHEAPLGDAATKVRSSWSRSRSSHSSSMIGTMSATDGVERTILRDVAGPVVERHIVRKRLEAQHQHRELQERKPAEEAERQREPRSPDWRADLAPEAGRDAHHLAFPLPGQKRAGEQPEPAPWSTRPAGRSSACRPRCPDS